MYLRNRMKYTKPIKTINAGEYYISDKDEFIGTLLGSCIAVCLYDPVHQISGMNHFMLPGKIMSMNIFNDKSAKYGIIAISKLLDDMISKGAEKKNLISKLFGGGSIIEYESKTITVPTDNIRLANAMIELEDIPIVQMNVGESFTRKLLMDVKTGKVFLKKTINQKVTRKIRLQEEEYHVRRFSVE